MPKYQLVENRLASMLYIHSSSAHYTALHTENDTKSVSTTNTAITENTECSIVEVCTSFMDLKVGVSLDHDASLCY